MRLRVTIPALIGLAVFPPLLAAWWFFGPLLLNRATSLTTPEGKCAEARLTLQIDSDPEMTEKRIEAEVAMDQAFGYDMTDQGLRQAEETRWHQFLILDQAEVDFWCNR